jgi:hypothetical protein
METEEFFGLVLAVIGVGLLAFFGVKVYDVVVGQDMKNAHAFIDNLNGKIENLGEIENNTFALSGVNGWVLVGWNKDVNVAQKNELIGRNKKPQKCFGSSCLCLCEGSIENCQEKSYCKNLDKNVGVYSEITYTGGNEDSAYTVNIKSSCLVTVDQLMGIMISKNKENVTLSYNYGVHSDEWINGEKDKVIDALSNEKSGIGKLEGECLLEQKVISNF